jgi:fucose permease
MAGDAISTYGRSFGLPLDVTKYFTSATLVAMILGYIAGLITIPRFISQEKYLTWSAILGIVLTIGAFLTKGYVSVGFVAALGFANAMMWPAIFPLGIKGLGKLTEIGSAFLVMGIAGGGVITALYGYLKQTYDFQLVFMALMVPCYAYILFFGLFAGSQGKKS